jgi:PBSX family phage terminase large subunit
MKLHENQAIIARDTSRFRVCCTGRRWGKTTLAVEEMKGKAIYKEARVAYIAPTYQQARDIAWEALKKELHPIAKNINESRLEITVHNLKQTTSQIVLRGWESIETLRGQWYDFIVIDEVASMRNFQMYWQEVVRPTLTDREGEALFISTPKGFNHFYELYQGINPKTKKRDPDYKSFTFTSYDNPHVTREEIDKAKEELTEDRFAQEYLADFRKTEGLVYKEFSREQHLSEEEPRAIKTIVGLDWGYTNPAAILQIKVDHDNNYHITDEWYKTQQTTDQIIQKAKSFTPQEVYPDPAEPDRLEELRKAGLNVREVNKDIPAGINKVRELFKQNRIKIHPRCQNLIHELETYRYPERGVDFSSKIDYSEKETPIKKNDHACDSLRYALYTTEPEQFITLKTSY